MRIYFVRHGESQANLLHEISNRGLRHGLTYRGREQAAALAQRLQRCSITRIYSSPLLRAIETSVLLGRQWQVEYEITDALREYDCGLLEARSDEAAWQQWQELFEAWTVHHRWEERIEGGESFYDLRRRFEPFVERLVRRYSETQTRVACVSHGGLYRMMLPLVLRNVDTALFSQHGIDYTTLIVAELQPGGLYCVEWNGHPL
ncbi:MAG: histidine phosphatase family protein [Anaerolineae bacterium]|jgi:broad specificity phosphatase PhoE